jgi:G3E family GTPase
MLRFMLCLSHPSVASGDGPGDELERVLGKLVSLLDDDRFDYVIIETTGIANPAPIVQTFFRSKMAKSRFHLDGIVCVVDAMHIAYHLQDETSEGHAQRGKGGWFSSMMRQTVRTVEAQRQIAFADVVLLNKVDSVPADKLAAAEESVQEVNSSAEIIHTVRSIAPLDKLLDIRAFDLDRVDLHGAGAARGEGTEERHHHGHDHSKGVSSAVLSVPRSRPFNEPQLTAWLSALLEARWRELYRLKGILWVVPSSTPSGAPGVVTGGAAAAAAVGGEDGEVLRFVVQGVHAELYGDYIQPGVGEESSGSGVSNIALIGVGLTEELVQELQAQLEECCVEGTSEEGGDTLERTTPTPSRRRRRPAGK